MLAKSKRRLCKHQLFVRKPTRYRTSEPQDEAHFSPSRAVVSCDFQGATCKKEKRLTLSIGSQQESIKRARSFEKFYNPPHLYKGIQSGGYYQKATQFTNCLRLTPPTISAVSQNDWANKIWKSSTYLVVSYIAKWPPETRKNFSLYMPFRKDFERMFFNLPLT